MKITRTITRKTETEMCSLKRKHKPVYNWCTVLKLYHLLVFFKKNMHYILMFSVKTEVLLYIFQLVSIREKYATIEYHFLEFYTNETKSFQIFHLCY